MVLHRALGLASRVIGSITGLVQPAARRVSVTGDRAHIEVAGVHCPGTERAARRLEQQLTELDGVRSAEVNAVLGRVVVAHDTEHLTTSDLARVVEEVEREHQLGADVAAASEHHPANVDPALLELLGLGLNLAGVGLSVTRAILPIPQLSPLLPGLLSLVDSSPRLQAAAQAALVDRAPTPRSCWAVPPATCWRQGRSPC
jgi:cation-transporting P-type ATPase I